MELRNLMLCWGKSGTGRPDGYHPAVLHMLDVAAVALEMMDGAVGPTVLQHLLHPLAGITFEKVDIAHLVACHDIGKLSPGFQAKVPSLASALKQAGLPFHRRVETDHGRVTHAVLPALLVAEGMSRRAAHGVARSLGAHHGSVPPVGRLSPKQTGGEPWQRLREDAFVALGDALAVTQSLALERAPDSWLMLLAGLTTVADWIGSNETFFRPQPEACIGRKYLDDARQQAVGALRSLGWTWQAGLRAPRTFASLFFGWKPTAVQTTSEQLVLRCDGPGLLIVEAPTGVGKTEAALVAAEQWMGRTGASGIYYALPTQATSNQMVGRVRDFLASSFDEERINLHLVHAASLLNDDYADLALASVNEPGIGEGSVVADQWFRSKRRTLLSPFAVGTVDQVLLAALQCRHFFVRLFALAGKVVVIDEVHAYDAFMSRILDQLLAWLRELDCSVVLLSATLPSVRRRELLQAWHPDVPAQDSTEGYPRITCLTRNAGLEIVELQPEAHRRIGLEWRESSTESTAEWILARTHQGGCAAWICNTVAEAQAAFAAIGEAGLAANEGTLFHARFPLEDRLERERSILERFGKTGTRPHRHVVVATQVIEQSLDLDFDLMVSALAPIDLLLQRAGRMHRHDRPSRPAGLGQPELVVIEPGRENGGLDWGPSRWVYHPHVLLRTWCLLRDREHLDIPGDLDRLIAFVYDRDQEPPEDLASEWERTAHDLEKVLEIASRAPERSLVPLPGVRDGVLRGITQALDDDTAGAVRQGLRVRTRDIDETVRLICLTRRDDGTVALSPMDQAPITVHAAPSWALQRRLLERSVSIAHRGWVRSLRSRPIPDAWARCSMLRGASLVVFDQQGNADVEGKALRLDPALGLVLDPKQRESS